MDMTVSADTLSVTCSGWTANDQTRTFEVRTLTQDCGFTSDTATNSVTLSSEWVIYCTSRVSYWIFGLRGKDLILSFIETWGSGCIPPGNFRSYFGVYIYM